MQSSFPVWKMWFVSQSGIIAPTKFVFLSSRSRHQEEKLELRSDQPIRLFSLLYSVCSLQSERRDTMNDSRLLNGWYCGNVP